MTQEKSYCTKRRTLEEENKDQRGRQRHQMPGSSLPPPVGIMNGKPMTTVQAKQALNSVASQAKGYAAVNKCAEEKSQGSYALAREGVSVFILIHDRKFVPWQSQRAPVHLCVLGWNESCCSLVRKEPSVGSRKSLANRSRSELSVIYQLFLVVMMVVRLLKVVISL